MNQLLIKQETDLTISKSQFIEDIDCLFETLRSSYGLYEYFGHNKFMDAKEKIGKELCENWLDAKQAVLVLKKHLMPFIKDGHFRIGYVSGEDPAYNYAVKVSEFQGIPYIDCKKFYYDNDAEKEELDRFVSSAPQYKNDEPLIIDLRDNLGGSDIYIFDFMRGLFDTELGYKCIYTQKYSELFKEVIRENDLDFTFEGEIETIEDEGVVIDSNKVIYVLINENTSSSGESAIAYLKTVKGTVVVGNHSAGCFTCGNCITIYLPNSHLPVYFGTGMVLYEKTRNIDAEGGFGADISYEEFMNRIRRSKL